MAKENSGESQHKPGPLKQQNKTHKHGRHKTKGMLNSINKGRVSVKMLRKNGSKMAGKLDRRNHAKQLRANKREEVLREKRKIGKLDGPPQVVCLIPLSASCNVDKFLENLYQGNEENEIVTTAKYKMLSCPQMKQWFSFCLLKYGELYEILDAAKAADVIVFLMEANHAPDQFGETCLSCVVAQGIPSCFHVVQGLRDVPPKKQNVVKKSFSKLVEHRFPKEKVYAVDTTDEGSQLLRILAHHHHKTVVYKDVRSHISAYDVVYEPSDTHQDVGTLKVSGYVRNRSLSANQLVHIPGFGNYQLTQIDSCRDPCPGKKVKRKANSMNVDDNDVEEDGRVLQTADPVQQETLVSEVVPNPMDGEQTWPTEEELKDAEATDRRTHTVKKVPKGTSEYQSSWIVENDDSSDNGDVSGSESDDTNKETMDHDITMEMTYGDASDVEGELPEKEDLELEEYETISVNTDTQDSRYDEKYPDDDYSELEKKRAERENELFPDEIDTPLNVPARIRFQKYRGLKSFRTSPWDPKENLPSDYARIFQFENFDRTKRRILKKKDDEGALPGWFVTIHVKDVPKRVAEYFWGSRPLTLFGLLPHEQKISVLHFILKRHPSYTDTIKAKEELIFQCGYKRFSASPIFSQHCPGNKFKMERFLPKEGVVVATVYASITFPPSPTLVFKRDQKTGILKLVATGSLYQVNPDRIVTKKIVLSGLPFKINKKSAVVRHMFFNRDDIAWFKPVELWTKYGRRGHIKEPMGTHGHMKCLFDGLIKAQDTVCMNLYKRIFPKWTFSDGSSNVGAMEEEAMEEEAMDPN
ncbi:pre-rRNA-processing protein TSR1 homolog [Xenia sp. Carnegie-2017]|uniref:pre-rRNA-processing protein TSR1 homolog n=1 Tax=Xenia sp. Carnegie-2017 TaxID=2897299 RepID=UPI001F045C00|nr:pre-rRNA-processing protein TSR1 homolog [Xenia sp. Carnegie-2017]XP_046854365.1 pre-rRNA-processing protein TSR1 homolog [Xenia sp. Carnegie-2017]